MVATAERMGVRRVNGADLYHEVRGSGPGLLMIQGAIKPILHAMESRRSHLLSE